MENRVLEVNDSWHLCLQHNTQTGTKIPGWCVCCTANIKSGVRNTFAQFWFILTELFYTNVEMMSTYIFFFASRTKLKMDIVVIITITFWRWIFIQLLLCKIQFPDSSIKAIAVCSSPHSTLPPLTSLNASSSSPIVRMEAQQLDPFLWTSSLVLDAPQYTLSSVRYI